MMFAFRILLIALLMTSPTLSRAAELFDLQQDAMAAYSGLKYFAGEETVGALDVDESKLSEQTIEAAKSHLNAVKKILRKTKTTFSQEGLSLNIKGGQSLLGKWVEKNRQWDPSAKFVYSPVDLALAGADATYSDMKNEMNLSAASVVFAEPDSTIEHELLHLKVSRDPKVNPALRTTFFVDKLGESLNKNAFYYSTFLTADEIITHLFEVNYSIGSKDEEQKQFAADKLDVLKEISTTISKMTREFAKAAKENRLTLVESPQIRGDRKVLALGPWRLDLNAGETQDPQLVEPLMRELAKINSAIANQTKATIAHLKNNNEKDAIEGIKRISEEVQARARIQFPSCRQIFSAN